MAYQDRKRRYFDQGDHNDWNDSKANIRFQNDFTNGQSDSKRSRDERLVEDQLPFELKEYVRSVADGVASMGGDQDASYADELASKCLEECKGHEISICCDAETSRYLETICRASIPICVRFLNQLFMNKRKSMLRVFTKAVGSRCLESLLYELRNYLFHRPNDKYENIIYEILNRIGDLFVEEFDTLVACMNSTHILRAFGRVCCGLGKPERNHGGGGIEKKNRTMLAKIEELKKRLLSRPELKACFMGLTGRILDWKSMFEYYYQESISCLVQEYIQLEASACGENDRNGLRQLITSALEDTYKQAIIEHWTTKQASRIWESIVQYCRDDDLIEQLYRNCLIGQVADCAMHPFANFPLQRLLERCVGKALAIDIADELLPFFEQLWTTNRCGVLVALAATCAKNKARQKEYKKALCSVLECNRPKNRRCHMFTLALQLSTYDSLVTSEKETENDLVLDKEKITTHGSAIVQHLLRFKKPACVVDGLLKLNINQLMDLACHFAGSHVFDAFFSSETISEEQKVVMDNTLMKPMALVALAGDKFGSRLVEKLWDRSNTRNKSNIAEALTTDKAMTALIRTPYGQILWNKYRLERYKISPKDWRSFMSNSDGKKRMLEDLLKE